jgi:pimeloyl-ACP methyl ester carboxylesterase
MSRLFNSILSAALAACVGFASVALADDESSVGDWGKFNVGSTVIHIELTGTAGERRPMAVLLFYPADAAAYESASPMLFASRLQGRPIIDPNNPDRWLPMSYAVVAERARQGVAVDQGGPSFPLIIFSHPAQSDPLNAAPTLERLASHGYVIAAPWHERDTQDDRIIDVINSRAGAKILQCFDGGPSPCLDPIAQRSVQNRALDVRALLDSAELRHGAVRRYFGDRVDPTRAALLGQSRGSVTALSLAGGSAAWNIASEPRIRAIMIQAIAQPGVTSAQDVHRIDIPSVVVAGKIDRNTPMAISVEAFNEIPSQRKALVILERAEHGVYGPDRCAKMQAAGAILQAEPRAIGEQLTLENVLISANSGTPLDFCRFDWFVNPVDIRPLVKTMTGFDVTPDNVPRQLDNAIARRVVLELANTLFDAVLIKHRSSDADVQFKQYLAPKFLLEKEGAVVSYAESHTSEGRAVACDDPELVSLDLSCTTQGTK